MSSTVDWDFDSVRYTRAYKLATISSTYIRVPIGTGVFEILTASLMPSNSQTHAIPARFGFYWEGDVSDHYRPLKSGYIGAQQPLTMGRRIVVGPGILTAWREDNTELPWFEVTYRRIAPQKGGTKWW